MEPLFFGKQNELYGVFQSPNIEGRNAAVLLCYPIGHEYMRIHRPFTWLAAALAKMGIASLRFDFRNTGDSEGAFTDARIEQWQMDAREALGELRKLSGLTRFFVVGVRVGSIVALDLVNDNELAGVVLWEPRITGREYVDEMIISIKQSPLTRENFVADDGALHYQGFRYSPLLLDGMNQWHCPDRILESTSSLIVASNDEQAQDFVRFTAASDNERSRIYVQPEMSNWSTVDAVGGLFLPQKALTEISQWIEHN